MLMGLASPPPFFPDGTFVPDFTGTIYLSTDPLQAFNAAQTAENNDYVAATAKPKCKDIVAEAGFVGPIDCDPSEGPVTYTPADTSGGKSSLSTGLIVAAAGGLALLIVLTRR